MNFFCIRKRNSVLSFKKAHAFLNEKESSSRGGDQVESEGMTPSSLSSLWFIHVQTKAVEGMLNLKVNPNA